MSMSAMFAARTLLALLSGANQAAQSDDPFKGTDCNNAQAQVELNYCANRDFEAEDKKLNAVYRKLMAGLDPQSQALLKAAEKNWLVFRDSECEFETAGSEGGSIRPMEESNCLTEKTKARIKELQDER
jgi:uncharacterized protein YecT (DUF1311 family)